MAVVRNRQMARKDRHRIAQNEVVVPVEDRLLFRRKMVQAEETGAEPDGFGIDVSHTGIVVRGPRGSI